MRNKAVNHQIATVTDKLLDLDLGDVLVSGWRKYTELTKAAVRTLASPGSEETTPYTFELTVTFDLNGVAAVVRQGNLVALRGGECVVTATLTLKETQLELSRKGRIDLALVVPLRRPVPLARQDHSTSSVRHPSTSRS